MNSYNQTKVAKILDRLILDNLHLTENAIFDKFKKVKNSYKDSKLIFPADSFMKTCICHIKKDVKIQIFDRQMEDLKNGGFNGL